MDPVLKLAEASFLICGNVKTEKSLCVLDNALSARKNNVYFADYNRW